MDAVAIEIEKEREYEDIEEVRRRGVELPDVFGWELTEEGDEGEGGEKAEE